MLGIGMHEVLVVVTYKDPTQKPTLMKFKSRSELTPQDIETYFWQYFHDGTYEYQILDPDDDVEFVELNGV